MLFGLFGHKLLGSGYLDIFYIGPEFAAAVKKFHYSNKFIEMYREI